MRILCVGAQDVSRFAYDDVLSTDLTNSDDTLIFSIVGWNPDRVIVADRERLVALQNLLDEQAQDADLWNLELLEEVAA